MPDAADLVLEAGGGKGIEAIGRQVIPRLKNDEASHRPVRTAAQAVAAEPKQAALNGSATTWETKAEVTQLIGTEGPH